MHATTPYCGRSSSEVHIRRRVASDPVDIDERRHGLPCRAGSCSFRIDVTGIAMSDPVAFGLLCASRVDHERAVHGYVHEAVPVTRARYDWGKGHRRVLAGQGI